MATSSAVQRSDFFSSTNDSTLPTSSSTSTTVPPTQNLVSTTDEEQTIAEGLCRGTETVVQGLDPEKRQDSACNQPLSDSFSPFLTPPLASTPRSPISPSSVPYDMYHTTPPSTRFSQSSFSPLSSSPLAHPKTSFDPVVGGGGGGGHNTPSRSRIYSLRNARQQADFARGSTSLPITPAKPTIQASKNSSSLLPFDLAAVPSTSQSSATWPFPSRDAGRLGNDSRQTTLLPVEAETPTKKGKNKSAAELLFREEDTIYDLFEDMEKERVATRYLLVQGVDRAFKEQDLNENFMYPLRDLSLKGCFTSRLSIDGSVVLAFHDVRDSLTAARDLTRNTQSGDRYSVRCITRNTFEQLHDIYEPTTLLSKSEGVLVVTTQRSTYSYPTSSSSASNLIQLLSLSGEIRSNKVIDDKLHLVEYYDDRDAEKAFRSLDGTSRNGMSYSCSFEPAVTSHELPALSSKPLLNFSSPPLSPALSDSPFSSNMNSLYASSRLYPTAYTTRPQLQSSLSRGGYPAASTRPRFVSSPSSFPSSIWQQDSTFGVAQSADTSPWTIDQRGGDSYLGRFGFGSEFANDGQMSPYESLPLSPPYSPRARTDSFPQLPTSSAYSSFSPIPASSPIVDETSLPQELGRFSSNSRSRLPPSFGIVRDDRIPVGNVINYERIESGLEVRTTLMLKNVPNKLVDTEVMQFIEEVVGRSFDFFYLRTDYATGCNVGYGFVNFTSMSALLAFCKQRLGTRWNLCNSDKLCILSFANIQGKASLINHFKNSSVLDQDESRRPKLFVTNGPNAGQPERFPMCDDPVRKMRSALNAANVGLFPSQKPVFKIAQAFQGMGI